MRLRGWRVAAVFMACGTLLGCMGDSTSNKYERGARVDMQAAANRADQILDSVLEEVRPAMNWAHGPTSTGACDVSRMRAVMTIIAAERRGNVLGLVERFWRQSDYRIKAVNADSEFPAIYAETRDGFGVSLSFGGGGQAFFEADSPCVDKSEVAEPTTQPNGPTYEGVYPIPRPNIRSPFWSAGAP